MTDDEEALAAMRAGKDRHHGKGFTCQVLAMQKTNPEIVAIRNPTTQAVTNPTPQRPCTV